MSVGADSRLVSHRAFFLRLDVRLYFDPKLAENPTFVMIVVTVIFGTVTLLNFRGLKTSGVVAAVGLVLGTILPTLLVILFAAIWWMSDHPIAVPEQNRGFFPKLEGIRGLAIAAGMITFYSGLEVNAVHGLRISKPRTSIPFAMILSASIVLTIYIFGSLGIAMILPPEKIRADLNVGPMEMFRVFLETHNLGMLSPVLAACVCIGA